MPENAFASISGIIATSEVKEENTSQETASPTVVITSSHQEKLEQNELKPTSQQLLEDNLGVQQDSKGVPVGNHEGLKPFSHTVPLTELSSVDDSSATPQQQKKDKIQMNLPSVETFQRPSLISLSQRSPLIHPPSPFPQGHCIPAWTDPNAISTTDDIIDSVFDQRSLSRHSSRVSRAISVNHGHPSMSREGKELEIHEGGAEINVPSSNFCHNFRWSSIQLVIPPFTDEFVESAFNIFTAGKARKSWKRMVWIFWIANLAGGTLIDGILSTFDVPSTIFSVVYFTALSSISFLVLHRYWNLMKMKPTRLQYLILSTVLPAMFAYMTLQILKPGDTAQVYIMEIQIDFLFYFTATSSPLNNYWFTRMAIFILVLSIPNLSAIQGAGTIATLAVGRWTICMVGMTLSRFIEKEKRKVFALGYNQQRMWSRAERSHKVDVI